jgi:hypothetical protein
VASATENGNPRKSKTGNCTSPAPPPAKADIAFAKREAMKRISWSVIMKAFKNYACFLRAGIIIIQYCGKD